MSDYEGDKSPKGNEWEVVALTDSSYAASPGPKEGISDSSFVEVENPEIARAMFMSGHFGFPSEQEKVHREGDHIVPQPMVEQSGELGSIKKEDINMEGLISDGFPGEKGDKIPFNSSDFGDVLSSKLIEKEQFMYDTGKSGSFHDEANALMDEDARITEPVASLDQSETSQTSDVPKRHIEDDLNNLTHETWWRKHAASIHAHAKNVNPVWSIVVAAASVGLVIVGYRLQRDKDQVMQLKPRLAIDDEGSRWILDPVPRFIDVALSGQNSPHIRVLSATEH